MPKYDESALFMSALGVLLDKAGGKLRYTQTEYAAIRARRGDYQLQASIDMTGPGEPVIEIENDPEGRRESARRLTRSFAADSPFQGRPGGHGFRRSMSWLQWFRRITRPWGPRSNDRRFPSSIFASQIPASGSSW